MADTREQDNSILFELNQTFGLLSSVLDALNKFEDKLGPVLRPDNSTEAKDVASSPINPETSELYREILNANMKLLDLQTKIERLTIRVNL